MGSPCARRQKQPITLTRIKRHERAVELRLEFIYWLFCQQCRRRNIQSGSYLLNRIKSRIAALAGQDVINARPVNLRCPAQLCRVEAPQVHYRFDVGCEQHGYV